MCVHYQKQQMLKFHVIMFYHVLHIYYHGILLPLSYCNKKCRFSMELPYNFESESRCSIFTGELFQVSFVYCGSQGSSDVATPFTCLGDLLSSSAHTYASRMLETYSFITWLKNVLIQPLKMKWNIFFLILLLWTSQVTLFKIVFFVCLCVCVCWKLPKVPESSVWFCLLCRSILSSHVKSGKGSDFSGAPSPLKVGMDKRDECVRVPLKNSPEYLIDRPVLQLWLWNLWYEITSIICSVFLALLWKYTKSPNTHSDAQHQDGIKLLFLQHVCVLALSFTLFCCWFHTWAPVRMTSTVWNHSTHRCTYSYETGPGFTGSSCSLMVQSRTHLTQLCYSIN